MTVKFNPTEGETMSAFGTVDGCVDVEVWEDGMVCFEIEGCDGSHTFTTNVEDMEEVVKFVRDFMEKRKNRK